MKHLYTTSIILFFAIFSVNCSKNKNGDEQDSDVKAEKTAKFTGNYNKSFNDLHDLHAAAALKNGIEPLSDRVAAERVGDRLVLIPEELPYYKTDKLTHSIPYLVPKASTLLVDIAVNFRDSLISKGIVPYKLILTSLTRTNEDVKKLTKRNFNASHNSAHCYGTTFDISWKRFEKISQNDKTVSTDRLKYILGQVLSDLKQNDRCYIKHEKKQACFHITVR